MRIFLHDMFHTDTLRDRRAALLVVREVSKSSPELIQLDFANIIFASRSFCHELLIHLTKRDNVRFENVNEEIRQMMIASLKKPENYRDYPMKKPVVC
jgi:hypothetical protein